MGKVRNSNFSPRALAESKARDKERAYNEKLKKYGIDTYDPKSLNKGVFAYDKDGRLIVRQLARAASARHEPDGETKVNRSNARDYGWDDEKHMYRDKSLDKGHYTTSSSDKEYYDVYGVESVYDLDPETGALTPVKVMERSVDPETGVMGELEEHHLSKPDHFSFRDIKPNASYFGQWLKVRRGISQDNFDKLAWGTKVQYMREAKQDMMLGWQHAIENGYDPELHRFGNMPFDYNERDTYKADEFFGRSDSGYSRSGGVIKKANRGRGRPEKEKLNAEQAYYRNKEKYKDLDDETRAKVLAEEFTRKDAGQLVSNMSNAAKRSQDDYLEYKRRKALEAENKDQEPEADPKMGETPSDERTKRIVGAVQDKFAPKDDRDGENRDLAVGWGGIGQRSKNMKDHWGKTKKQKDLEGKAHESTSSSVA